MPPTFLIQPPPIQGFTGDVEKFGQRFIDALASALREDHEVTMPMAKEDCPVAIPGVTVPADYKGTPGTLRASGTVFPTEVTATHLISRGGFGGAAKSYAVYVHEILTNKHKVGHAKFYENALLRRAKGQEARLAASAARKLGTGK